ncbi:MAG: hypothetical protein WCC95_22640 [Candidatus Sulfotelmatobacter sp.]
MQLLCRLLHSVVVVMAAVAGTPDFPEAAVLGATPLLAIPTPVILLAVSEAADPYTATCRAVHHSVLLFIRVAYIHAI